MSPVRAARRRAYGGRAERARSPRSHSMSDRAGIFTLDGRTALVTGARGGIGRAASLALADAGADLVLGGPPDDLAEVAAEGARRAQGPPRQCRSRQPGRRP